MYVVLGNGASNVKTMEARQETHMFDWDRSPHIPMHQTKLQQTDIFLSAFQEHVLAERGSDLNRTQ